MNDPARPRSSGPINETHIHPSNICSGQSSTARNTAFTTIESAPAMIIRTPDTLFAGYHTSGDDRVFGVLMIIAGALSMVVNAVFLAVADRNTAFTTIESAPAM